METIAKLREFNKKDKQERQVKNKIEKKALYDKQNSRHTDHIMTDVDIDKEAGQLHQSVRDQIAVFNYINSAKENKANYLKKLQEDQERETRPLELEDVLILPFETSSQVVLDAEAEVSKFYGMNDPPKMLNAFYHGVPSPTELAEKIKKFRNEIRAQKANLSDVAHHVKIIPVVMQLLKSPFYRSELAEQYTLWRQLRTEMIKSKKFSHSEDDSGDKRAEEDVYEHSQKIKIGGILKHLLDLWTVEDIFQACILCAFWISGRL